MRVRWARWTRCVNNELNIQVAKNGRSCARIEIKTIKINELELCELYSITKQYENVQIRTIIIPIWKIILCLFHGLSGFCVLCIFVFCIFITLICFIIIRYKFIHSFLLPFILYRLVIYLYSRMTSVTHEHIQFH